MTVLQQKIYPFTQSLKEAIETKNYYAALTVSLILPDICSKLEYPDEKNTGKRYSRWYDKYMSKKYNTNLGSIKRKSSFLSGNDFYALRCSFLHQGETEIINQKAREVLNNFRFIEPPNGNYIHNNKIDDTLQLQVDVFCNDILQGVYEWVKKKESSKPINERAHNLISIHKLMSI